MTIDEVIKNRKTQKVMAPKSWKPHLKTEESGKLIDELLDLAAYAPYHFACDQYHSTKGEMNSCLPYRFYVLDCKNCRKVSDFIEKQNVPAGKVKNMLDAADVLFMVTWLPDLPKSGIPHQETGHEPNSFEGTMKNMEHIAATSAAIQNVLLGATARNIPSYWSSGGQLRNETLRTFLNIPLDEILMGAVFLFPPDIAERDAFIKPGHLREKGKETRLWAKRVSL